MRPYRYNAQIMGARVQIVIWAGDAAAATIIAAEMGNKIGAMLLGPY
ncbi:MAG: hypothetical protein KDK08_05435 [Rhizobiaceae bacterium]|nr:hypothetical protein [Rhizobiaceae bacterium]MCC0000912.1 hypothetical protein [Methylobacteriaceae bacterium]